MSGEKQTLHSTVRPSHVAAAPSRFADAVLHRDPFDLQPPRDSAPHERILQSRIRRNDTGSHSLAIILND